MNFKLSNYQTNGLTELYGLSEWAIKLSNYRTNGLSD